MPRPAGSSRPRTAGARPDVPPAGNDASQRQPEVQGGVWREVAFQAVREPSILRTHVKVPVTGGGYFRIFPYGVTRAGLRRINAAGRPFAFYLHPWEIDPDQPRVKVGAVSRFRHYTNLSRCEDRLHRLLGEFAFRTMVEALRAFAMRVD